MSDTKGIYSLTAPAVLAFPALLEARKFKRNGKETGDPKFGATFVFPADSGDLKAMKELAIKLVREKWPGRDLKEIKFPFKSGDKEIEKQIVKLKKEGKEYTGRADFMKGMTVLKASSKYQPRLSILLNGRPVDLEGDTLNAHKGKFYFGVHALAQFNFVSYDAIKDGDPDGITAYLNMVLSLNKGERLSGGASAAEVFKGYVGHSTTEDPTEVQGELDDEIPF